MIACIRLDGVRYGEFRYKPKNSVQCAPRPDENHVLADTWQSDPMNPSVCWRAKTQAELDAEKDQEAQREFSDKKLIRAVALWVAQIHNITPAEARNQIKAIYKSL